MCPDLSVPKVTCNTLLAARGTHLPSPPGGGRRSLPLGLLSGLREPDKTVQKLTILIDDRLNSFSYEEEDGIHFWQISTLSGYFASRWWMMLVVSLNQMPSMLSRTNGTWRRVAMSNQGHNQTIHIFLQITTTHLRRASLLFQSAQLCQAWFLSTPLETLQAESFDQE